MHSQLPIEKSTKSSCEMLRKSVIGKTEVNTECRPLSSRSLGSLSIWRKRSYDRRCTSMRLGIWIGVGILEKSSRLRRARVSFGIAGSSWARKHERKADCPEPRSPREHTQCRAKDAAGCLVQPKTTLRERFTCQQAPTGLQQGRDQKLLASPCDPRSPKLREPCKRGGRTSHDLPLPNRYGPTPTNAEIACEPVAAQAWMGDDLSMRRDTGNCFLPLQI